MPGAEQKTPAGWWTCLAVWRPAEYRKVLTRAGWILAAVLVWWLLWLFWMVRHYPGHLVSCASPLAMVVLPLDHHKGPTILGTTVAIWNGGRREYRFAEGEAVEVGLVQGRVALGCAITDATGRFVDARPDPGPLVGPPGGYFRLMPPSRTLGPGKGWVFHMTFASKASGGPPPVTSTDQGQPAPTGMPYATPYAKVSTRAKREQVPPIGADVPYSWTQRVIWQLPWVAVFLAVFMYLAKRLRSKGHVPLVGWTVLGLFLSPCIWYFTAPPSCPPFGWPPHRAPAFLESGGASPEMMGGHIVP